MGWPLIAAAAEGPLSGADAARARTSVAPPGF